MEEREYSNHWIATNDRDGVDEVMVVLSKWSPPIEKGSKWDDPYQLGGTYCWQDGVVGPPYPYSKWKKMTGRVCPRKGKRRHYASETGNLDPENYKNNPEGYWCYDANVSRTDLGILDYLNEKYAAGVEAEDSIIHIVVNSYDHPRSTISLDFAFPSATCDSHLPRFKDDVLFVGEYSKGQMRKGQPYRSFTGTDVDGGCPDCWDADELSMHVYSRHPASVAENSNGRRGSSKPISKKDVEKAEAAGDEWIIYEFSVKDANGRKLRIAFPIRIMKEITQANWNSIPIKVYPALDSR